MQQTKCAEAQWIAGLAELSLDTSIVLSANTGSMQEGANMVAHQHASVLQATNQAEFATLLNESQDLPWLLPFTDMFSKRRQFAVDGFGRVHLIVGKL